MEQSREALEVPCVETVRATLTRLPDAKGSDALQAVWDLVPMKYRKREAAAPTVKRMRELAANDAAALMRELAGAF